MIYPAIHEYSVTVLTKTQHNVGLKMSGFVTQHAFNLITSWTLSNHFNIQAALPTEYVLCYPSDRRLNAPHTRQKPEWGKIYIFFIRNQPHFWILSSR